MNVANPAIFVLAMVIVILTFIVAIIIKQVVRVVPHKHTMIIERLGKFRR